MLFSEIYSCYYSAVAKIISKALKGELNNKSMNEIISEKAFAESIIDIPKALKSGRWPFLQEDYSTVLEKTPDLPVTDLEKRWLRSLMDDPRIKLFDINWNGIEDVKPLFTRDMFVKFDVYENGDDYSSGEYIENFRKLICAVREKRMIKVTFSDNRGVEHKYCCAVENLEYSSKNDRFRAIGACKKGNVTINLSAITDCELLDESATDRGFTVKREKKELVAELLDVNNALERVMIAFSYFEKETSKIDDNRYRLTLRYYKEDEAEVRIQILSFGTNLRVISPDDFVCEIKNKIGKQKNLCKKLHRSVKNGQ